MIVEKAVNYIFLAAKEEREAAIRKHGRFNSQHEAWAVLREELQEVEECSRGIDGSFDIFMADLWSKIRTDDTDDINMDIERVEDKVLELTKECIQVLAVCSKWKESFGYEEFEEYE